MNFANSLFKLFSDISQYENKRSNVSDLKSDLYNYASHYFVAKTIYTLNNYDNSDFSNFNYSIDNLSKDDQHRLVNEFVMEFASKIDDEHVDSNEFKKDILYNEKIKQKGKMPEYESFLTNIFTS